MVGAGIQASKQSEWAHLPGSTALRGLAKYVSDILDDVEAYWFASQVQFQGKGGELCVQLPSEQRFPTRPLHRIIEQRGKQHGRVVLCDIHLGDEVAQVGFIEPVRHRLAVECLTVTLPGRNSPRLLIAS